MHHLVYLKNLYYIENKIYNIKKLDFLVKLKDELDEHNLLKYNHNFRKYLTTIDVIIYGIRLDKYLVKLFKNINYKYIEKKYKHYEHNIYYLS